MAAPSQTVRTHRYRPAKPITDEMRVHCHIYLDEQLYSSALTLLSDIITAGVSHPDYPEKPGFGPQPFHIELVSALLIHPSYTNQAPPSEASELTSRSISFLRNVLSILGPLNAHLKEAFCFTSPGISRSSRQSRNATNTDDGTSGSDSEEMTESMKGILANRGRIRNCAKDFWHIVGWAFNCSVNHPNRWKYWKVWLEYMLDVIDADWKERERLEVPGQDDFSLRKDSLLAVYLLDVNGRSSAARRVVKSLFADGDIDSLKDFPEVFPNEIRHTRTQSGTKRKRDDSRRSEFDYNDSDEAEDGIKDLNPVEQPSHLTEEMNGHGTLVVDSCLGGTDAIFLRQRVLALLSRIAFHLPDSFVPWQEVYEMIYDCVKPLPLAAFCTLFSPSKSTKLPEVVSISLSHFLLERLLPPTAPRPFDITGRYDDDLSLEVLEKCLLPFSAITSSISDNVKVSILVEGLFRLFTRNCICDPTPDLRAAIERGILEREKKIRGHGKRKDVRSREHQQEEIWLKASSRRLRSLLSWLEQLNEGDDRIVR